MMQKTFSPARPCRVEDVARWDMETDVAIVGFGAAGTCANKGVRFIYGINNEPDPFYVKRL